MRRRSASSAPAGHRSSGVWDGTFLDVALGEHAAIHPDRVPVVDGDRTVGYRELDDLVRRCAAGLARNRHDLGSLRVFGCGAADVPPDLVRRADRELGRP